VEASSAPWAAGRATHRAPGRLSCKAERCLDGHLRELGVIQPSGLFPSRDPGTIAGLRQGHIYGLPTKRNVHGARQTKKWRLIFSIPRSSSAPL
jgi:hypothetical protein